jgi:hypothetical protein
MNLSVGILTHRSPITLENTLVSYKESGLLDLVDDIYCIIQPSDKANQELCVCIYYGVRPVLEEKNGMMAWGIKRVFEEAKHEYVLFLESDFRSLYKKEIIKTMLDYAIHVLSNKEADVIKLRSLKRPGHPNQSRLFDGKETMDDDHLGQLYFCTNYLEEPEKKFPEYVSLVQDKPRVYKMSSKNCVYSNNPNITSKEFFKSNILPYVEFGKHLEPEIGIDWKRKYNHIIYIPQGIFAHVRLDGHEGKGCWCCPVEYGGVADTSNCICCEGKPMNPLPFSAEDLLEELL